MRKIIKDILFVFISFFNVFLFYQALYSLAKPVFYYIKNKFS